MLARQKVSLEDEESKQRVVEIEYVNEEQTLLDVKCITENSTRRSQLSFDARIVFEVQIDLIKKDQYE